MNIEEFRNYCIQKKGVTEEFPFDKNTLVFKVMGKMFALTDVDLFNFVNLKCDPEKAIQLREEFEGVLPAYHMSKTLWNSVVIDSDVGDRIFFQLIDESYGLVIETLTKKLKEELEKC